MEKNVLVVDQQGNEYEATWPKRAKGLVKSGRARFIADNKICLTRPPDAKKEGTQMSEQSTILSTDYLLKQIEKIANDTEYLHKAIDALNSIQSADVPGDMTGNAKAEALAAVVRSRETTNQQLLSMYMQMLLDCRAN